MSQGEAEHSPTAVPALVRYHCPVSTVAGDVQTDVQATAVGAYGLFLIRATTFLKALT